MLNIAIGRSRFEKKWQNKTTSWDKLVERLSTTKFTKETQAEYFKMSKSRQDQVKDIGGFVGGHLRDGKRRKNNVINRSIITLDADYAKKDLWTHIELLEEFKCLVYSTHTHTPDKPRLRVVIPLDRPVIPDEYEAISRKVAERLGIDQFDDTTHQAARLMYWPSTSKDAEYFFRSKGGITLSADKVLAEYDDWTDISFWPLSSRESEIRDTLAEKQENPLDKDNLIGAFCRSYSITEAIEIFIPEVYIPTKHENRYSFAEGSSSHGLVIYDDIFAYSNHATDPAGGILCNAFDLVRIHKFGDLDDEAKPNTPVTRMPSFVAMSDLANADSSVKKQRYEESVSDFDDIEAQSLEIENEKDWVTQLEYKKSGGLISSINNFYLIVKNHKLLKGKVRFNEFTNAIMVVEKLEWDRYFSGERYWNDNDESNLRHFIEVNFQVEGAQKLRDAVNNVANEFSYHPVRDYLDDLKWDGQKRLENLFIDYLGADDSKYTQTVTRKAITAAVARIYRPGIKFDYMLTLTGGQGIGKSTIIRKLAKGFVNDSLTDVRGKDAIEALQGSWYIEMAELTAARRADVEAVKQFVSKQVDKTRLAYRRNAEDMPRQCIFIGTTNEIEFLRDTTGNRRFWPLAVDKGKKSVFDLTEEDIDQINAEAKYYYEQGEKLYLEAEMEEIAISIQEDHAHKDDWVGIIESYLNHKLPLEWEDMSRSERRLYFEAGGMEESVGIERTETHARAIWEEALGMHGKEISRPDVIRINDIMRKFPGWEYVKITYAGVRYDGFRKTTVAEAERK